MSRCIKHSGQVHPDGCDVCANAALAKRDAVIREMVEAIEKDPCRNESSSVENCMIAERIFITHPYCGRCHALVAAAELTETR